MHAPIKLTWDNEENPTKLTEASRSFYLYDSLRLYFANGGEDCYVYSVGKFSDNSDFKNDLEKGIEALKDYEEPTLLLIPDAAKLEDAQKKELYTKMLAHCKDSQRRFAILDAPNEKVDTINASNVIEVDDEDHLNWGALYYPWLKANVVKSTEVRLKDLTFEKVNTFLKEDSVFSTILNQITSKDSTSNGTKSEEGDTAKDLWEKACGQVEELGKEPEGFKDIIKDIIASWRQVSNLDTINERSEEVTKATEEEISKLQTDDVEGQPEEEEKNDNDENQTTTTDLIGRLKEFKQAFERVTKAIADTTQPDTTEDATQVSANQKYKPDEKNLKSIEKALLANVPAYRQLVKKITDQLNQLPPCGAVAGQYVRNDNRYGVQKAPANAPLSRVTSLTQKVNDKKHEALNVPVDGLSINCIRAYRNRGIRIMGARTLDGNSIDWRYINVRRTMVMLEQSIRNFMLDYIFAPNENSTWVKIRAAMRNFLTRQWQAGVLTGETPEKAFAFAIGEGETMTAEEINDGIMRLSVSVAIARPAEFIVITFEQKQNEPESTEVEEGEGEGDEEGNGESSGE
jgi:hypothetical protein